MNRLPTITIVALALAACGGHRLAEAPLPPMPPTPLAHVVLVATDSAPGVVRGVVLDSATGSPVFGVAILVPQRDTGAFSDDEGRFTLPVLPPGTYALNVRRIGYQPSRLWVAVRSDIGLVLTIRVSPRAVPLQYSEVQ